MPADLGYLITGIPGAGKTTVAASLAKRFERAVHIEADLLQGMVVSGGVWPGENPPAEAEAQLRLRAENAGMLATSFAAAGFIPVIDDVIVGRSRLAIYEATVGLPLLLVVLAPPLAVALERDELRGYKRVGTRWAHLDAVQRAELHGHGLWIDTGRLGAQQTVDAILGNRGGRLAARPTEGR